MGCTENSSPDGRRINENVDYYLNRNASEQTLRAVETAFENWEAATHFTFTYKGRNTAGLNRDGRNTVSFLTDWPDDIPFGKTAWCRNWYDHRGNIIESDLILNQELARFTSLESAARTPTISRV